MSSVFATFVALLVSNMASPIYPLWQLEQGFSDGVISVLFAVYPAGVLTALFGVRQLLSSRGWRSGLLVGTALAAVSALLMAVADGPWVLGLGRYVSGLGVGVFLSVGASAMTAVFELRGVKYASRWAAMTISAGFAFGAPLAGLFADHLPDPTSLVFQVEAVALVFVAACVLLDPSLKTVDINRHIPRDSQLRHATLPMLPTEFRTTALWAATWVMVACGIACAIFQSIGSAYLAGLLGTGTATLAGLLVFLAFGSAFAGQLVLASRSTRTQAWVAVVCGGLGAILLLTGMLTDSVAALFVAAALSGASQGLGQAVGFTIARQTTELDRLPRVLAMLNILAYGLAGGAIMLSWPLINATSVTTAISVLAATVFGLTFMASAIMARHQRAFVVPVRLS